MPRATTQRLAHCWGRPDPLLVHSPLPCCLPGHPLDLACPQHRSLVPQQLGTSPGHLVCGPCAWCVQAEHAAAWGGGRGERAGSAHLAVPAVLLAQNLNSDDQDVVLRALKRVPEGRLKKEGLKALSLLLVEGNSKVVSAVSAQLRSLAENPRFRQRVRRGCEGRRWAPGTPPRAVALTPCSTPGPCVLPGPAGG